MSLNKFMHPRNIYKSPPNFKELAILYPEFRKHCKQDVSGKIAIDFKDPEALRALTKVLLMKDFGLQVEIPSGRLVPTLPLRLNYLLWIEDLLLQLGIGEDDAVRGIDIGTGASCIYPLLAAKKSSWYMTATEVNPESVDAARSNVECNNLQEFVKVHLVDQEKVLLPVVKKGEKYDFCMCNPPFFKSEEELNQNKKSRTANRHPPHNAWTASVDEAVAPGGEVALITKIVEESLQLKNSIRIYTAMIGVKSDIRPLKDELQRHGVKNSVTTEFCQGRTTRWGLAWTFSDQPDLQETPRKPAHKKAKPMVYSVPAPTELENYTVRTIYEKVKGLLTQLQIKYKEVKSCVNMRAMTISAHENTWSHQRRQRRKMQKASKEDESSPQKGVDTSVDVGSPSDKHLSGSEKSSRKGIETDASVITVASKETHHTTSKLQQEYTSKDSSKAQSERDVRWASGKRKAKKRRVDLHKPTKKIKIESTEVNSPETERNASSESETKQVSPMLNASIVIKKDKANIMIQLTYIDGSCGKDGVHQVLQYIKNNLK